MIEAIYLKATFLQRNPINYSDMVERWKLANQDRNGVSRELCAATMLEF